MGRRRVARFSQSLDGMIEPQRVLRRAFLLMCLLPIAAAADPVLAAGQKPGSQKSEPQKPRSPSQRARPLARQEGAATFYSRAFHGRRTASGERYDERALTAAHPSWPFGTMVRVTEIESGRSVVVRITDRGPVASRRRSGVIIDLSRAAARRLRIVEEGRTRVRLEVLEWGAATSTPAPPQ